MEPSDVRQHLARHGPVAVYRATVAENGSATPSPDKVDAVFASISSSYFRLRRGLAAVTLAFPLILWLGAGGGDVQGSISAYYHFSRGHAAYGDGTIRDVFVGVLWMIGSFLFFYKGYSAAENWALNIAGLAAVLISLFPLDWPYGSPPTVTGRIHDASAIVFFLAVAYVCLWRSGDTLQLVDDTRKRGVLQRVYGVLGTLMIALPLTIFLIHAVLGREPSVMLFAIEVAATYVFAVFWLVKSREIAIIEGQARQP